MTRTSHLAALLSLLLTACNGSFTLTGQPAPVTPNGSQAPSASPSPTGQATNVNIANKIVQAVRVVPESHIMTVGEAKDVMATVQYTDGTFDSNVTYAVSDSRIAEVNGTNGKISAKSEGVVSVIVASMTDPAKRVLVTVTVRKGVVQEAITRVEPASVTLEVGQTRQLTASVQLTDGSLSPNVQWESSNQGVALVSATGLVTAVGKGKATITARAAGDALRRASCEVTVE